MAERLLLKSVPPRSGAYAHAVIAGGFVYVSGQGPVDPQTGTIAPSFDAQVVQTLLNVKSVLTGAQSELENVVRITAYLSDLSNFDAYNTIFESVFGDILPARTTIGCKLRGIMFEVDCIAHVPTQGRPGN